MVIQYHFSITPHRPLSPLRIEDEDTTASIVPHISHILTLSSILSPQMKPEMGDITSLLEDTMSTCSDTPDLSDGSSSPTTSLPGWASQRHNPVSWRLPEPCSYDASGRKAVFELLNDKLEGLCRDKTYLGESQVCNLFRLSPSTDIERCIGR